MQTDRLRSAGDLRAVGPAARTTRPVHLRRPRHSSSRDAARHGIALSQQRAVDQLTSIARDAYFGLQGPDAIPQLDQSRHHLRG